MGHGVEFRIENFGLQIFNPMLSALCPMPPEFCLLAPNSFMSFHPPESGGTSSSRPEEVFLL
jgi:hypothetical protein